MCHVREWNLSYESLTSFSARKRLREMKDTDPEFWKELTGAKKLDLPTLDIAMPEDLTHNDDQPTDDSELPLSAVKEITNGTCPDGISHRPAGGLMSVADAERLDLEPGPDVVVENTPQNKDPELGRGKRRRVVNKLYT